MADFTPDQVREMLKNDEAVKRGLLAIYARQTADEQAAESTSHLNGIGFNGVDAPILSSFAKQLRARNWLSEKQLTLARRKMTKYAGQLARIANQGVAQ